MMREASSIPWMRRLYWLWLTAAALVAGGLILAWTALAPPRSQPQNSAPLQAGRQEALPPPPAPPPPVVIPPFEPDKATHVLTAFSPQGMRQVAEAEPILTLLPPGTVLAAQFIERGSTPSVITEGATLAFALEQEAVLSPPGSSETNGTLVPDEDGIAFSSRPIPILDHTKNGTRNAFPLVTVTAHDGSGVQRGITMAVLPVSTQMHCGLCHGAANLDRTGGIVRSVAEHILSAHDAGNKTRLLAQAASGSPVDCRSCHGRDPARLNLSTAIHGFHAAMRLTEVAAWQTPALSRQPLPARVSAAKNIEPGDACMLCHAPSPGFSRDIHALWGLDCTRCHGVMEDHALSLLRHEAGEKKQAALARMAMLKPVHAKTREEIHARIPRVNLPRCGACHDFQKKPSAETASAFNDWTASEQETFSRTTDNTGSLRCPSCHGPTHALYPATGPWGDGRDNIQPLQYQKIAAPMGSSQNCAVCHKETKDYFIHHDMVE